jgi:hypothetical protein
MIFRSHLQQAFVLMLAMLFLAGCGGAPVEPTSTSTPAPTPISPTETPIPPPETHTPIPPTVTATSVSSATLIGRLLFADSEEPAADTSIYITGEEGTIAFESGILVNPIGETDSTGNFEINLPEEFLREQDYKIMVLVSLKDVLNPTSKLVPLTNQDGAYAVFQIDSVPSENDLGVVYVQR